MQGLELKHLAPYFPYKLKGFIERSETFYYLDTFNNMMGKGIESRTIDMWLSNNIKPILRPLSDLKKEIDVNGEKFIPIIELAKMAFPNKNTFEIHDTRFEVVFNEKTIIDKRIEYSTFAYDCIRKGFCINTLDSNFNIIRAYSVPNQLQLFEKIFEWHFDLSGLIEKNLAIDINTL